MKSVPFLLALAIAGCHSGGGNADGGALPDASPSAIVDGDAGPSPCPTCAAGMQCDPATSACVPDCRTGAACATGNRCDPLTGNCVAACQDSGSCDGGVCSVDAGTCVECLSASDCPIDRQTCQDNVCGGCGVDGGCSAGAVCDPSATACVPRCADAGCQVTAPVCNVSSGLCEACQADADCGDGGLRCDAGACFACGGNADCQAPTPICRASTASCVACLTAADCAPGAGCNQLTGACGSCLTQADCGDAGTVCDLNTYVCRTPCGDAGSKVCPSAQALCDPLSGLCEQCASNEDCDGGFCGLDLTCTRT